MICIQNNHQPVDGWEIKPPAISIDFADFSTPYNNDEDDDD
jgi:hypothetical protein